MILFFLCGQFEIAIDFSCFPLLEQLSNLCPVHKSIKIQSLKRRFQGNNLTAQITAMAFQSNSLLCLYGFELLNIIYHKQLMLRLLSLNLIRYGNSSSRRQNFFELNPIYPDNGQKDFDIYNVDYKHIRSGLLAISDEERYMKLKEKLKNDVYLKPVLEKNYDPKKENYQLDEETGFPLGIHEDFDDFIEIFKRQRKVGDDVLGQFEDLTLSLMKKFDAKTENELIKIFRFNLATLQKQNLKDKLRGLLINNAFIRFIKDRKNKGKQNFELNFNQIQKFIQDDPSKKSVSKKETQQISQQELEEIAFRNILKQFDAKIEKIEQEIRKKSLADKTFIPTFHPKYGQTIKQEIDTKPNYDLNYGRGYASKVTSNLGEYTPLEVQQRYIQKRINQLFFLRALNQVQKKHTITVSSVINNYDLPINIRSKDKIINSILHKYKEYDLIIEPNLQDIYNQIDIALKKIAVKVVPNYVQNQLENELSENGGFSSTNSTVKERIISKDALIWSNLDVQEIFDPDHYEEESVSSVKLKQSQLVQLSPSVTMELSLNKMPMNLYRHADLDNFGIFNKYRKRVYKDYITDRTINPEVQFKFFSLEQAKNTLSKVKKPNQVPDRYYGYGKRKSSEAEVYITKGTGKVIINNEPLADYCGDVYHRGQALKPLIYTETAGQFDLQFTVVGGGIHSQAQCMSIALTNALIMVNPRYKSILEQTGLVGIDDRKKQAKKMGFYSARVRPPYVRR